MDAAHVRANWFRNDAANDGGRPRSRNKIWSAGEGTSRSGTSTPHHADGERWERGGHRGSGRGTRGTRGSRGRGGPKFSNVSLRLAPPKNPPPVDVGVECDEHRDGNENEVEEENEAEEVYPNRIDEPELETQEEREQFYQELVKSREIERKRAIAEGKMDDPLVPKRLEDAISIVGTCEDMCPRFERYRRERENNLFEWEVIPGTKRVDHNRAVKMYERAAGDKTIPSDLRPPHVLKRTLDYLFHDLCPRGGFSQTFNFIRDRSRSVRNDFTMQHLTGAMAIECHDRCARFHILALHVQRDQVGFSIALEEQQLMNTLQSLKEFYEDQRGRYESPTELEMRVYHRLIHIRDQRERHEDIPEHITSHPVFRLTTDFRLHVQRKSAPISKTSALVVDAEGMEIFGRLANVLREQGSVVMIFLVACILERLFGKETIDEIEGIKGNLSIPEIIDGVSARPPAVIGHNESPEDEDMYDELRGYSSEPEVNQALSAPAPIQANQTTWLPSSFSTTPVIPTVATSAFSNLVSAPNVFGTPSLFGSSAKPSEPGTGQSLSAFGPSGHAASAFVSKTTTANPSPLPVSASPLVDGGSFASAVAPVRPRPATSLSHASTTQNISPSVPIILGASNTSPTNNGYPSTVTLQAPFTQHILPLTNGGLPSLVHLPAPAASGSTQPNFFASTGPSFQEPPLNPRAAPFTPTQALPLEAPKETHTPTLPSPSHFSTSTGNPLGKSSASASGSITRTLSAPPSLKIDTTPSINSFVSSHPGSPALPPPLAKPHPIPLPLTPNTTIDVQPPNALIDHLRSSFNSSIASNNTPEILSPLILTPTASPSKVNNFSPAASSKLKRLKTENSLSSFLNGKGKAPESFRTSIPDSPDKLKAQALAFAQKGLVVKTCFKQWLQRTIDKAAWLEACQHSESYREKVRHQKQARDSLVDKKRRISNGPVLSSVAPQKKRVRRRVSAEYKPPRTDEELARRFKENHEEHERRWAQGSFLQVIRNHVKRTAKSPLSPWHLWLSINPESDATAIWMERKFDVPTSGQWISEIVYSIPLFPIEGPEALNNPGVIVFECTPLEDVADDIERKYRILDDCSRLRDIVKALPPKRHFIPALLVFCWTSGEKTYPMSDFFDMVNKLVSENTLQGYSVLQMTASSMDLDQRLDDTLILVPLDTEGKLVQTLTIRGIVKLFEAEWNAFVSEWIENCSSKGYFDWKLYNHLLHAVVALLNRLAQLTFHLITKIINDILPSFPVDQARFVDSESAYNVTLEWLSSTNFQGNTAPFAADIQSHWDIDQEFPARTFIEHLVELAVYRIELQLWEDVKAKYYIPSLEIKAMLESFNSAVRDHQSTLNQVLNLSTRRSPKRRSHSLDTERSSPDAKRMRFSASVTSTMDHPSPPSSPLQNGRNTPSPSNSTVSVAQSDPPIVTVAMLRALTKDFKKKYTPSS